MLGLVFEGGGAKGAFQMGLVRALVDNGYKFDGVVGSSIGSLNAAMFAQGDFDTCYRIWNDLEFSKIFDLEDLYAENLANKNFDSQTMRYLMFKLKEAILNRGLDTTKIRSLINYYVDEEKIRNSPMDYGLMTTRMMEDKKVFRPFPMFKEDMQLGHMHRYILASLNFPGFKSVYINNKPYRDGGLYDNLPMNMLIDRGYKEIFAVQLRGFFSFKQRPRDGVNITYILPSEKPGRMLDFCNEPIARSLEMGYLDGMRFVKGYIGKMYYIDDIRDYEVLLDQIMAFPESFFLEMAKEFDLKYNGNKSDLLFDVCSKIRRIMEVKDILSTAETFMELLESIALDSGLERLKMYTMKEFVQKAYDAYRNSDKEKKGVKTRKKMHLENAFLIFTKYYK